MSLSYGACRILVCITTNMYSTGTILWMLLRNENLSASTSYSEICGCDNQWSMTVKSQHLSMKLILLCMEVETVCTTWFHMYICSLSRKCEKYTALLQNLRVVFLHEFISLTVFPVLFYTSSALGLDDTVGNFEVSNC